MQRKVAAKLFVPAVAALVLWLLPSFAKEVASQSTRRLRVPDRTAVYDDSQTASNQDIELLRQDFRSQKKQMIAANMSFTDAEAEKFWPVYDRYAADLAKIYDTKMTLIEDYMDNYKTMSGEQVESYIPARGRRRRRNAPETQVRAGISKILSGRQTALFFQIEWRLDLMINLQLAQAPLIDP